MNTLQFIIALLNSNVFSILAAGIVLLGLIYVFSKSKLTLFSAQLGGGKGIKIKNTSNRKHIESQTQKKVNA